MARGSFRDALRDDPRILNSSMYATHIDRWHKVFGTEKVLVVFQEELKNDPASYIKKICSFLELPYREDKELLHKKVNPGEMARNIALAGVANRSAHLLRSYQLYGVVNFAKKLGLKKLVFGGGKMPEGPTEDDIAIMESSLKTEVYSLEDILGQDLGRWVAQTKK